jgi:hypothetical protein
MVETARPETCCPPSTMYVPELTVVPLAVPPPATI